MITLKKRLLSLAALLFAVFILGGCTSSPFYSKEKPIDISTLAHLGKKMSCTKVGNLFYDIKTMQSKGMSRNDVYWKITPEDATFGEQSLYYNLINVGFMLSKVPRNAMIAETCENVPSIQSLADSGTKILYENLDSSYDFFSERRHNVKMHGILEWTAFQDFFNLDGSVNITEALKMQILDLDSSYLEDPEYATHIDIQNLVIEDALVYMYSHNTINKKQLYEHYSQELIVVITEK